MLLTNSTLEELILNQVGMTAHGLRHLCDALSTHQSLPATSSSPGGTMPNGHMAVLKKLNISFNKIGEGGAALLGAMLAHNRCLRSLHAPYCSLLEEDREGHLAKGLRENSNLEELDISKHNYRNDPLDKVDLGPLVRCLAYNTSLKKLDIGGVRLAAEELARVIAHNHSLLKLGLASTLYDAGEWASVILPALGRNKTLLSIDMSYCAGVEGQQVRAALFDLVRINTIIEEIDFRGTRLWGCGEMEAVQVELHQRAQGPSSAA